MNTRMSLVRAASMKPGDMIPRCPKCGEPARVVVLITAMRVSSGPSAQGELAGIEPADSA